uniref:Decapping nuclease n=1 Tax=Ascaris suum TaxID=6253 RepID=F1L7U0_ASCSU
MEHDGKRTMRPLPETNVVPKRRRLENEKMSTLMSLSEYFPPESFPLYKFPSPIAEYSVTKERNVVPGRAEAKYFYGKILEKDAAFHFDLNKGFEIFESKDDLLQDERLDILSKWLISRAAPNVGLSEVCFHADFVCYRGLLTRIASTPYDVMEDWIVGAVRIGSTIFLCEFRTEEKKLRQEMLDRRDKLMCYWGFKFEQYVTTDSPDSPLKEKQLSWSLYLTTPVTDQVVSNMKEFDVVMRTTLGNKGGGIRLLFSAETDCLDSEGHYLELKTQAYGMVSNFWKLKAMKWWIQSFLAGVQQIVVGIRDNKGVVRSVKRVKVAELCRRAVDWTPSRTFNFLLDVLTLIKSRMYEVHSLSYMLFEYNHANGKITFRHVPTEGDEFAQYRFLSDDFLKHFGAGAE